MALEFQRGDIPPFNSPEIALPANLAFDQRLRLISKQILQYQHMYPLDPKLADLAQRVMLS
jgi:hypothetical protein